MKKILITIMFISLIVLNGAIKDVSSNGDNEVQLYDFYCDSPRFMYTKNISSEIQSLNCTVNMIENGVYESELIPFDLELRAVDKYGDFIYTIDTFSVDYKRSNVNITYGSVSQVISDNTSPLFLELREEISGEIIEVDTIINTTTNTELVKGDDWFYDEATYTLVVQAQRFNTNDNLSIFVRKYDSTSYDFNYQNTSLSYALEQRTSSGLATETIYYQFLHNDDVIYNGMIIPSIKYDTNTETNPNISIDFGEDLSYYDTINLDDIDSYTYNTYVDDYIYLHYQKDPNFSEVYNIKFYDIASGTIEDSITTDDIFFYQGDNTNEDHKSFIPLRINNSTLLEPYLLYPSSKTNDIPSNLESFSLSTGVYLIIIEDQSNNVLDYADRLLIISDKFGDIFNLDLLYDEISLLTSQRLDFYKNDPVVAEYFNTTNARDLGVLYDYSVDVDNATSRINFSYKPLDTLLEGDVVSVIWTLEPVSLPQGINVSEFQFTLTESYTITDSIDTDKQISSWLDYQGWSDVDGLLFVSVVVIFLVNIVLMFILGDSGGYIVYAIVNSVVLLIESSLGWLPVWLGILVGLLVLISVLFTFTRKSGAV